MKQIASQILSLPIVFIVCHKFSNLLQVGQENCQLRQTIVFVNYFIQIIISFLRRIWWIIDVHKKSSSFRNRLVSSCLWQHLRIIMLRSRERGHLIKRSSLKFILLSNLLVFFIECDGAMMCIEIFLWKRFNYSWMSSLHVSSNISAFFGC